MLTKTSTTLLVKSPNTLWPIGTARGLNTPPCQEEERICHLGPHANQGGHAQKVADPQAQ